MSNSGNTPNPGSPEAMVLGCKCPVMDNAGGRGYMMIEGLFVYNESCPVHYKQEGDENEGAPPEEK